MAGDTTGGGRAGTSELALSWRRLRAAGAWAAFGDGVIAVALPLLAAEATRDPFAVAAIVAAMYVPWALAAAFGPVVVGGADRRTVMGALHTARAVGAGWLGVDALAGDVALSTLSAVAILSGLAVALVDDAEWETVDAISPSDRGERSGGRFAATEVVADGFVGLPVGAVLFSVLSPLPLFAVALTSTVAALLALSVVHGPLPAHRRVDAATAELAAGFRALLGPPAARTTAAVAVGVSLAGSAVLGPLVLVGVDDLGLGALGFGMLLTAIAAGSLVGGLGAPDAVRRSGVRPVLTGALLLGGAAYGSASLAGGDPLVVGGLIAVGALAGMVATVTAGLVRHPGAEAARALHVLAWGAIPVGALAGGLAADAWGLRAPLVAAAAALAALAPLALLTSPTPAPTTRSGGFAKIG